MATIHPHDPETGELSLSSEDGAAIQAELQPDDLVADDAIWIGTMTITRLQLDAGRVKTTMRPEPLCRIWGVVNGTRIQFAPPREGEARGQAFTGLSGEFEASNYQNGLLYRSDVLHLPTFQAAVLGMFDPVTTKAIEGGDGAVSTAPFAIAFELASVPAKNPTGYSYIARAALGRRQTDRLARVREQALQRLGEPMMLIAGRSTNEPLAPPERPATPAEKLIGA